MPAVNANAETARNKDGDEWKTTASFGRDDLPVMQLLLKRAWEFILDAEASRGKEDTE